ncbi:hypothetical protein [Azohydromonas lata]|uniref:hypothetical protein n=1 Tax=Azohydromonas lata TaxID=45677 RepID=UPI000834C77C|nr:hypothetical protein [Azohydromonas lata]
MPPLPTITTAATTPVTAAHPIPDDVHEGTPAAPQSPLQRAAERLRALKRLDDQRPSVPGEHWFAFGTGAALLLRGRRSSSALLRTAATVGGLLFMARGLSGRDGLLARLQQRPDRRQDD